MLFSFTDANERISTDNIESIAYQACDKIYKQEDSGPYDSLLNSMLETLSTLNKLSQSLENGVFDSTVPTEKVKFNEIKSLDRQWLIF